MSDLAQKLQYPSDEFLAPPSVSIQVPPDWKPIVEPGTLVAARLDLGDDVFAPNVVVTATRTSGDPAQVLDEQAATVAALPEVAGPVKQQLKIHDLEWTLWEYAFSDPRAGTLAQLQAAVVIGPSGGAHLVTVVASASGDSAERLLPTLRAIVETVVVA